MKRNTALIAAAVLSLMFWISGCATPSQPTAFERAVWNIQTNYVTQVITNRVDVPVLEYHTNVVTAYATNSVGVIVPEYHTNVVTAFVTNHVDVPMTNLVAQSSYGPGAGGAAVSGAAGLFGYGTLATLALSLVGNLLQRMRNGSLGATAANTAQAVETARELIKSLPNGSAYDTAFVNWLQSHQSEAGVTKQIIDLIDKQVDNPNAQVAAATIQQTIDALLATSRQPQQLSPKVGI